MCNNRDIAKLEAEVDVMRKAKRAALDRKYAAKRRHEVEIAKAMLATNNKWLLPDTFRIRKPYVACAFAVKIGGQRYEGLGIAKCKADDEWHLGTGKKIALIKTVRHIARQAAGLE